MSTLDHWDGFPRSGVTITPLNMGGILAPNRTASDALTRNWLVHSNGSIELALFMLSACAFTVLFFDPASSVVRAVHNAALRRLMIGIPMGLTASLLFNPRSESGLEHTSTLPSKGKAWRISTRHGPAREEHRQRSVLSRKASTSGNASSAAKKILRQTHQRSRSVVRWSNSDGGGPEGKGDDEHDST